MSLDELEAYFSSLELPKSIQLDECTWVNDVQKLIDSNISYLRANTGNKGYMPYYNQLIQLKDAITTKENMEKKKA